MFRMGGQVNDAEVILAMKRPNELFSMDAATLDKQLRKLRSAWHPDRCTKEPLAKDVFSKITELYDQAFRMLNSKVANRILIVACRGTERSFSFALRAATEFGALYCSSGELIYEFKPGYEDLVSRYLKAVQHMSSRLKGKVRENFHNMLPALKEKIVSDNSCIYLVLKVEEDHVPLSLLMKFMGSVPAKHAAWITSRMLNTACLFKHTELVNNTFSLSTYFVNPKTHTGMDYGGFMYTAQELDHLTVLSKRAVELYPSSALLKKEASSRADIVLIKDTVSRLLGDSSGSGIKLSSDVPEAFRQWLRSPSSDNTKKEFKHWMEDVLPKAFGERKFAHMGVTATDIFLKGN